MQLQLRGKFDSFPHWYSLTAQARNLSWNVLLALVRLDWCTALQFYSVGNCTDLQCSATRECSVLTGLVQCSALSYSAE